MEMIGCSVCGLEECQPLFSARDYLSGHEFAVVRCRRCGLSYVNPRPAAEEIGKYYSDGYYGKRHAFFPALMMELRARKLPELNVNGRLLDIGCGHGDFILSCRKHGWRVAGVEQAQAPVMALKERLGIEVYEPEALAGLEAASFDVVTIWHVLEHLPEPERSLREVHRLLKPGGIALIEVPNFGGWQGRFGGPFWFHLDVPRHLFHFDRAALAQLLRHSGLEPVRWQTFSLEYDVFGLLQTMLNRLHLLHNHLFQVLIGRRLDRTRGRRDTLISFALSPFLLAVALPVSLLAAAVGQGGVLRVWARKQ
jgi:2-polyprenyl-3-methyl-5-hydroxy-6-metoxy-1,4-benzoquinol methylase